MPLPTDAMIKRLGSVNCLSLAAKDGVETRLCRLALSMFRLKIDLLFVCETKRNAWFGEKRFDPDNKVTCLFGDFNKTGGVGFLMTNHLKKFIVYSKFIGTRLGRVDFNMGGFIVACVVVYAPTQCSDQKSKDLFYKELEEMCNLEAYDKLIIGGDFNGRIGSNYRKKEARLSF
uniref:Endo/exonuclease/phosphatase domain-containing protein n=1 Tax=Rhabditophanes sp. KR3021 TaxID=114890 RepID=A0AC35TS20_9BILA